MTLSAHTTTTFQETDAEVAILPTGSTEQHGPALPLGTDFLVAESIAEHLDRSDAVVLPTIPVGVSEHHRQFDGTLWVSEETFERYVRETLASMANHGICKSVVVNGHGGNSAALHRAARQLRQDETVFAAPWNWWNSLDELEEKLFEEDGGHADAMETSMVYRVDDELVRSEALDAAEEDASDSWGRSVHGAEIGFDTIDFSESGATGTPTEGTREKGDQLFEKALSELDALVDWLTAQSFGDLLPREHQ
jgi:creatinine amidohydrolase